VVFLCPFATAQKLGNCLKIQGMINFNMEAEERKAGSIARAALKASIVNQIKNTFKRRSGALEKSTVNARYKQGSLDRLTISMPHYSFKQHFGSSLTGTQKATEIKGANVKSFDRHLSSKTIAISSHAR
jgi:uncharacterized membrane protein YcgQ (UPF0703/DUF1980 family)